MKRSTGILMRSDANDTFVVVVVVKCFDFCYRRQVCICIVRTARSLQLTIFIAMLNVYRPHSEEEGI